MYLCNTGTCKAVWDHRPDLYGTQARLGHVCALAAVTPERIQLQRRQASNQLEFPVQHYSSRGECDSQLPEQSTELNREGIFVFLLFVTHN